MNQHHHHNAAVHHYNPPPHVRKEIIKHAVRKMPGGKHVVNKCYNRHTTYQQGLKQHKYNDGGKIQWAFMN